MNYTYEKSTILSFYEKIVKDGLPEKIYISTEWNKHQQNKFVNNLIGFGGVITPIILFVVDGKYKCIDGFNRIIAIKEVFESVSSPLIETLGNLSIPICFITSLVKNDLLVIRNLFQGALPPQADIKLISEKTIIIHQKTKTTKKAINEALKAAIWSKHIGIEKGVALCVCCKQTRITQREFDAGHVIAEINGGQTNLNNLRPVCRKCNLSMGAMNMDDYIGKNFGD